MSSSTRSTIQEVSGVYILQFLDTDELKMALRARKVSGAFEKEAAESVFSKVPKTFQAPKAVFS